MTREESERYIKSQTCNRCGVYLGGGKCSDNCIVVKAIKALEKEPCEDDLISRQAAIEALSTITMYKGSIPFDTAVMRIEQLPSAQPQRTGRH